MEEYASDLSAEAKKRYLSKLTTFGFSNDPYSIPDASWVTERDILPQAWKAMTGCDSYVKDGWVLAMKIHYFRHDSNNRCIVMGKVRHSQKINAAPVLPWVVLELNGTVLCAHCTCMAGAAESQKKFGEDACTSKKCSWLPAIKEVAPSEIVTINFSSSTTDCAKTVFQCKVKPHHVVQPPTDSEIDTFYQTMNSAQLKPAILRIVPEYADQFAPGHLALDLPLLMSQLYKAEYLSLDYISLQSVCEDTAKDFQNKQPEDRVLTNYGSNIAVEELLHQSLKLRQIQT
ncbi:hypothetical protein EMCRGX_G005968 [Ephydatia muelleri]